jgi:hypothetical protein
MTTGCRIEPKIFRMRKRPKKTASNARITREPFGELPQKILPIPTFINDYNHYMGGVDQANQLRAAFTTYFPRNEKEFFPGAFWAIDMTVSNSYKLHLALNGSKTTSTGKRDPQQHRKWIEDLIDLLFQVDSDDFGQEIALKLFPKYQYQSVSIGPKRDGKEAFLKAINNGLNHYYSENSPKKRGYYLFCVQKGTVSAIKEQKFQTSLSCLTLQFNKGDTSEISAKKEPKRQRVRGKHTKWWCYECNKFICQDYWSLYH